MDMNKLKGILDKSKTLMSTVDSGQYKRGNIDASLLQQEGLVENVGHQHVPAPTAYRPPQNNQQVAPGSADYQAKVQNSKMPDAIKQAMLNNPIAPPDMSGVLAPGGKTFTLEDLGYTKNQTPRLNEQQVPMQPQAQMPPQQQYYQQPPQQYYAPPQQQAPTISRDEIKSIIKECLAEMLVNTISENSVKNTLKALVTEGKIKLKRKE